MGPGLLGYSDQEKERMVGRKPAAAWVLCCGRFCHVAASFVMLRQVLLCCCGFCYVAAGFVMLLWVLSCYYRFVMLLPELFCVMAERK